MELVIMISCSMRQEDVVSYNVWFSGGFSCLAEQMPKNGAPPRSLKTCVITLECETVGFIKGDPVLDSISKSLEAGRGIILEVFSVSEWRLLVKSVSCHENTIDNCDVLTLSVCLTILHIYLQASVEDPNDRELHRVEFLIENKR